jgi:threonine dehydratase
MTGTAQTRPQTGERESTWPITIDDVLAARERLRPYLTPTPLRGYPVLDLEAGGRMRLLVKHENHQPTNAFKVRNALSFMTALTGEQRSRGVIAATRGNHGLGIAYAGALLGCRAVICVPHGNNPEKNEGMRALGAELVEVGRDFDEALQHCLRLATERGLTLAHSTNDRTVIAGAATITLEMIEQDPALDALVIGVGGGSQAVGALTVARAMRPEMRVFAVQATGASAGHDGWVAGRPVTLERADTFADGLATRSCYDMTFPALRAGLEDWVLVSDAQIADAIRLLLRATHNLSEGAGAAPLAAALMLADRLQGKRIGLILSGGNIDRETLRRVVNGEL